MADAISRRQIAAATGRIAAGGGGLALLGALAAPARAPAQEPTSADATTLAGALGIEARLERTYAAASRSVGGGELRELLGAFRRDAEIHSERLREAIGDLVPFEEPAEPPAAEPPPTSEEWLEIALGFESQAYIGYLDAVGSIGAPAAIELVARLGAGSAQHLALLRDALGRDPIPSPFETGSGG